MFERNETSELIAFMNMCEHVHTCLPGCTMFRHVCTGLPNPVQVVRIPDDATFSMVELVKEIGNFRT